jgi:ABC-type phosphate/phosphonate transport system ATPase subunit
MNEERITYFAQTDARNKKVSFGIKAKDRTRHVYVIGKTGMGKSTLLENMAVQDIKNGEGFEADDLLGTLSRQFDHKEYDVVIVSGDMDVMQLINKNVFVYTMKRGNETAFFDEAGVLAKYGIKPTQIPDYKGLAGGSTFQKVH